MQVSTVSLKSSIHSQFNWDYFKMLFDTNPKQAEEYRLKFVPQEEKDKDNELEKMTEFCKKHGVKIFPNYKYETVLSKYEELKKKIASGE